MFDRLAFRTALFEEHLCSSKSPITSPPTMSAHPNIETLRDLVARDREFFKAQNQRLIEIQQSDPNTLSDVDKKALSNWDKSVVTDCNRQLLLLEEIKQPSAEERATMKELHELIILGDHIMEKRNLVRAELNNRLNAVNASKAAKSAPTNKKSAGPAMAPPRETLGNTDQRADLATTASPNNGVPDEVSLPSTTTTEAPPASQDSHSTNLEVGLIQKVANPRILYEALGVEPDASLEVIKKYDPLPEFHYNRLTRCQEQLGRPSCVYIQTAARMIRTPLRDLLTSRLLARCSIRRRSARSSTIPAMSRRLLTCTRVCKDWPWTDCQFFISAYHGGSMSAFWCIVSQLCTKSQAMFPLVT